MKEPHVILVDKDDNQIGIMPKLEAHVQGKLHRAISVFIFDDQGNWMLQKRAGHKYHSPNLWSNTCCSHPFPEEEVSDSANRRLKEEMGLTCDLKKAFTFIYHSEFKNKLIEHELDHVFVGVTNTLPKINKDEANDWKWISFADLENDVKLNPDNYTVWFKLIYQRVNDFYN